MTAAPATWSQRDGHRAARGAAAVTVATLTSASREQEVALPRQIATYLVGRPPRDVLCSPEGRAGTGAAGRPR